MLEVLDRINKANDIKNIKPEEYQALAKDIRKFLVNRVSKTGGHLASNLGVVELTMAMHLSLNLPEDKIVFDVGHQSYTHKILTGRKDDFDNLRKYKGMSGFPKPLESDCDAFHAGHSSTSISAALGLAKARDLTGGTNKVFAVIGDGALSGGMAYEALNNASRINSNLVIVLNDNNMSISENVGGMANYLGKIRTNIRYKGLKGGIETTLKKVPVYGDIIVDKLKRSKDSIKRLVIPGMLFEDMGLTYIGPIDGHNIGQLMKAFQTAKSVNEAVIVHVITKKGKGYIKAEKEPSKFHGVEPFNIKTGEIKQTKEEATYTDVFSNTIVELAEKDKKIVAISAAMTNGTGLAEFSKRFPTRFFDVGIAEEHAVTFAAGLAAGGLKPVVALYSTFLQRAYDQILHDVCIGKLPVVFAIDRAGIVGSDGETHQGIFDISFLSNIPNLTLIAPKNKLEFVEMLKFATEFNGPIAIRYPRGKTYHDLTISQTPIEYGKSEMIYKEKGIALLAYGSMVQTANQVRDALKKLGLDVTLVNVRFIVPFDQEMLSEITKEHTLIVTLEENVKVGGFGQMVSGILCENHNKDVKHLNISIPNKFIEHGNPDILKHKLSMDSEAIVKKIMEQI